MLFSFYVSAQVPDNLGAQYGEMIMHADGFAQVSLVQDGAVSCSSHVTRTQILFGQRSISSPNMSLLPSWSEQAAKNMYVGGMLDWVTFASKPLGCSSV